METMERTDKHQKKKRKSSAAPDEEDPAGGRQRDQKQSKKKKKSKKDPWARKAKKESLSENNRINVEDDDETTTNKTTTRTTTTPAATTVATTNADADARATATANSSIPFPHRYILAPMVGASELAFRLLCRRYGTQLAYTPMMAADKFAHDLNYRQAEFQTCPADRPLVCHFAANTIQDFCDAAVAAQPFCDAIDLNLGCPQRTAYLGHFGSYLLDPKDRNLICSMIQAATQAVSIPIFCKIRLLDTLDDTLALCQQLQAAGVSLIAIHARYRASWERKGPGARDGPALLDQVTAIKQQLHIPVIANGNTITYQDVVQNLNETRADGLMSAEGILDNPALFLPQLGSRTDTHVRVPIITLEPKTQSTQYSEKEEEKESSKRKRKLVKKLRGIGRLEEKMQNYGGSLLLTEEEKKKLSKKVAMEQELQALQSLSSPSSSSSPEATETKSSEQAQSHPAKVSAEISLTDLYAAADNKVKLAHEYLDLVDQFPVKIRSVVFHTRRMLKDLLVQYQLLETCLAAETAQDVRGVLHKIEGYQKNPSSFVFDKEKEKAQKEALERKRREEGKRKAYEARMIRKAKREGKQDLQYYLHQGAQVPTKALVERLRKIPRPEALAIWKEHHSQHCLAFHLEDKGCTRGRTCAFLHVDVLASNNFNEQDEVAG